MLYYMNSQNKLELKEVRQIRLADVGWTEEDLEKILESHIESLVRTDQLLIIARERRMQEEADIIALDQSGTLYLFEIKRWMGREDNLLQVLRYGQRFGRYDYARLNNLFAAYQHRKGVGASPLSLKQAHATYFELLSPLAESDFNGHQRFIVVVNGLDKATWDAIEYWKRFKLPVEPLIYRVYRVEGANLNIIDFDPYGPEAKAPESTAEGLFVVNTNLTYMPEAYKNMLQSNKASAYYDRKYGIASIRRGSQVCLYHNRVGVVAIGKASNEYMTSVFDGDPDAEYYVPCNFEYKVDPDTQRDKAVTAAEINQQFGTGHRFRQTVFTLGPDFADFIRRRFREKLS
jgi:hypothetical protein